MADDPTPQIDGPRGAELWRRTDAVIPGGGIYMSRSARFAGEGNLPGFIESAEGCRVTDVDGRSYIDFLCGNGPNLLGYLHPEVEEAARRQADKASLTSFYPPALPAVVESMLEAFPGFDWSVVTKCGSDTTALSARILRAATGRSLLITFKRAYHGFSPELVARRTEPTDTSHLRRIAWNDAEALRDLLEREGDQVAGVLLNPLDQNPGLATQWPSPELVAAIHAVRERGGFVALDDVRHGFRLHPEGSHRAMELEIDLLCLGKALGNGHSVAAVLGKNDLRDATSKLMFTSTFIFDPVAFEAAIKTLEIYRRDDVFASMRRASERLVAGIESAASKAGHEVVMSGPSTMPTPLFPASPDGALGRAFCREAAHRGAIFHPTLNWFLCAAHDDAAIDESLEIAEESFRAIPVGT